MKEKIELENKTILVTGSCGFIGYYLSKRLLEEVNGIKVIGFDNMNDYYDTKLKDATIPTMMNRPRKIRYKRCWSKKSSISAKSKGERM